MNARCLRSMKPCSPTELLLLNQYKTNRCRCSPWIWWKTRSHRALAVSWVDLINEARAPHGQALTSHHTVWTNQWTKATMDLFSSTWWCSSNKWWCLTMLMALSLLKTITTPSRWWRSNLLVWLIMLLSLTTTSSRTLCFQQSHNWIQLAQAVTIETPTSPLSTKMLKTRF